MPALREPVESIPESQLRPDTSFRAVIDVTGNHDERDGVFQRRVDEIVERQGRRISEGGDETGIDTTHPRERRVQVEIGGVEEPKAHRISSRVERLCLPCNPGCSWLEALLRESELARTDPDPQFLHRPMRYDIGLPSTVI